MSIFQSDPASCSGSNPLNKLVSREGFGQSLPSIGQQSQQQQQNKHTFNRISTIDANLQNEFNSFGIDSFQSNFSQPISNPFIQDQHLTPSQPQNTWINDFQQMNIEEPTFANNTSNWANDFQMINKKIVPQSSNIVPLTMMGAPSLQPSALASFASATSLQNLSNNGLTKSASFTNMNLEFDSAFNELEEEINQGEEAPIAEEADKIEVDEEEDKIKFAQLAQSVFSVMSNTPKNVSSATSEKFKQSNFLKLMNRISTREVEINKEKNRFIDSNGEDIRNILPDPLKDIKDELKNNNANSPFESAKIIHEQLGEQLRPNAWESSI